MVDVNGVNIAIGGFLTRVLDDMKEFPKHNWDFVNLVVGEPGDGKTTFTLLTSYYLDPNITIDQWAYSSEQFKEIINKDLPPGSCIVWDESDELAENWNSNVVLTITRLMKRIRSKRYIIWLITPTFFDMRKFFVIFRTKALFDVYASPERDKETRKFKANRGRVRFFGKEKKRLLYFKGVKEWNMKAILPDFYDSFGDVPSNYPIDLEALGRKKDEATVDLAEGKGDGSKTRVLRFRSEWMSRVKQWAFTNLNYKMSNKDLAWVFKVSDRQVKRDLVAFDKIFGEMGEGVLEVASREDKDTRELLAFEDENFVGPQMKGAERE